MNDFKTWTLKRLCYPCQIHSNWLDQPSCLLNQV
jgi:hypothetical protein